MREVLLINPRKGGTKRRRKTACKKRLNPCGSAMKGRSTMARKRSRKRRRVYASPPKRTYRRRRRSYRRNPEVLELNPRRRGGGRVRRYARRAGGRLFAGLNWKSAVHDGIPALLGMFAAKFAARKFGGGTETDPTTWTWGTYAKAAAGAFGGAFIANMIRPGYGQKVLNGGLAFVLFKIVENELVTKSTKAQEWFGADESWGQSWDGYGAEDPNVLQLDGDGTPWMMSDDGTMLPLDERHRMQLDGWGDDSDLPELQGTWGEALVTPGRLGGFGEALVSPGRLGQDVRAAYIEKYRQSYQG